MSARHAGLGLFCALSAASLAVGCARPPASPAEHAGDATPHARTAEPSYRIIGRADLREPGAPVLAWPGTTITATLVPTAPDGRVMARFREQPGPLGTSVYQVLVDGAEAGAPITLPAGESEVLLARLLPGPHRVDLVKRTEASAGTTAFLGFSGADLLAPPAPRRRALEVVGDSNTAAYGVDGDGPLCKFSSATENFLHGYAWALGRALDADVTATAYSGKGVLQNYARGEPGTLGELYPLANPLDGASAAPPPPADAVVLFAGGNDYSESTKGRNDKPSDRAFVDAYVALLRQVRAAHPRAPLVCVITPAADDAFPEGWLARTSLESNVRAAILTLGDPAVFYVAPAQADRSELTGCDYHPNRGLHARLAVTIAQMVEHALYSTRPAR